MINPVLSALLYKTPLITFSNISATSPSSVINNLFGILNRASALLGLNNSTTNPAILLAVPKKKRTLRSKRIRHRTYNLKNLKNITSCQGCGKDRLMHHICPHCFPEFAKKKRYDKKQ